MYTILCVGIGMVLGILLDRFGNSLWKITKNTLSKLIAKLSRKADESIKD